MCARSDLARRWRQVLLLALVVAIVGAVVLTATAGARRTRSSFDRLSESTRAYDVLVFFRSMGPSTMHDVRDLPNVAAAGRAHALALQFADGGSFIAAGAPADDVIFRDIARNNIVEGRDTAPGAPEEAVIGEPFAQQRDLAVGDSFELVTYSPEQIDELQAEVGAPIPDPDGPRIRMKVVGISRSPVDLSQQGETGGIFLVSPAFTEKYGDRIGVYVDVALVRLTTGAEGVPRFVRDLRAQFADDSDALINEVEPTALATSGARESIDVLAIGLAIFAAIAAASGLVIVGFVIVRAVARNAGERDTWQALGLTRAQRTAALAAPALVASAAGALLALPAAWLASALMPIGLARRAEPSPGVDLDPLVVIGGSAVLASILFAMALVSAWRQAQAPRLVPATSRSLISRAIEPVHSSPPASIGLRAALEPRRGRGAIPVRSTLVAAIVAVLGVVSVSVFGPSLDRLVATPALFGVGWDVAVDDTRTERPAADRPCSGLLGTRVARQPSIDAVAGVCTMTVEVDGHPTRGFGYMPMRGEISPTVIEGRAPRTPGEIALGADTADTVGRAIGQRVRVEGPGGARRYRVVGTAVIPQLGDVQAVADGAIFTGRGLDRVDQPTEELSHAWVVATIDDDADPRAVERELKRLPGVGDPDESEALGVETPTPPLEVRRLQQINDLPIFLAGFLALLGAAAIGYTLVTSIRRRRSELAILKTLGFTRRQVASCVAWQATAVACVGIVVGVPAGIVVGRLMWDAIATTTGVEFSPDVSLWLLTFAAIGALVVAIMAARLTGRSAARVAAASILRTE